jgi:hypothetical protein
MTQFDFGGYSIEVDERWLTWRPGLSRNLRVIFCKLLLVAIPAPWACVLVLAPFVGTWHGSIDQANTLFWVAARAFEILLFALGLLLGLIAVGSALDLLAFLARGMHPFTFDRWDDRFQLGSRTLCELNQIEGVCVDVRDDSEGGRQWAFGLQLKGGVQKEIPHFYPGDPDPMDVARFVNELASFLEVSVVKRSSGLIADQNS